MNHRALELQELVYAPIHAVAQANTRLGAGVLEQMKQVTAPSADACGKSAMRLKTIQLMYDRLNCGKADAPVRECVGVEVPLLSLVPLGGLQVSKTKLSFCAEVLEVCSNLDETRILVSPHTQASAPSIRYEIELESVPMAEGLARFVDLLNTQTAVRTLHTENKEGDGPMDEYTAEIEGGKEDLPVMPERFTHTAPEQAAEEVAPFAQAEETAPVEEAHQLPSRRFGEPLEEEDAGVCRPGMVPEYCMKKRCMFLSDCDFAREAVENRAKGSDRRAPHGSQEAESHG